MEQELMKYGLSSKEAKLYILAIKTGETTANRLIELCSLPRGTVYDILEKLKSKGLMSSLVKEKTTYFTANDPEVLIKDLEERRLELDKVVPELRKLSKTVEKETNIEVFEGFAGIKKVLDDVLSNCKEVIVMGNERDAREIIKHHPENFRVKRLEKKIKIRNLLEDSKIARELKKDEYSEVRHTDRLRNSKEVLVIYNDTTVHILMESPIKIVKMNSKIYTKTQRMLFDKFWESAK